MDVQVCSLDDICADEKLLFSLKNTGFAVLTDHDIDHGLIRECQAAWREFFLSGNEIKSIFINEKDPNMGYKGMLSEKAVGASKADLKEFFHWRPFEKIPYDVSLMTKSLFRQLCDLSEFVLGTVDFYEKTNYADSCFNSENTILRSLYYPAMNFKSQQGAVRAAAHEDINFITLLVAASAPGLQVLDNAGNWHEVPHEENSVVCNVGDMLQLASQGRYRSTTHRVVNPENSSSDRVSVPLFVHPTGETVLAPGITAQQYLNQRIAEIYQKGEK